MKNEQWIVPIYKAAQMRDLSKGDVMPRTCNRKIIFRCFHKDVKIDFPQGKPWLVSAYKAIGVVTGSNGSITEDGNC